MKIKVQGKVLSGMVINTLRTHLPMFHCIEKGDKIVVLSPDKSMEAVVAIKDDQIQMVEPVFEYDGRMVRYLFLIGALPLTAVGFLFFVPILVLIQFGLPSLLVLYLVYNKTYKAQLAEYTNLLMFHNMVSRTLKSAYLGALDVHKKVAK